MDESSLKMGEFWSVKQVVLSQNKNETIETGIEEQSETIFTEGTSGRAVDSALELEEDSVLIPPPLSVIRKQISTACVSTNVPSAVSNNSIVRKSKRVRNYPSTNSVDDDTQPTSLSHARRRMKKTRLYQLGRGKRGKPFCCDICKSPHVVNPVRRTGKKIKKNASPRHKVDPVTKKRLTLCNACGLSLEHAPQQRKHRTSDFIPSTDGKEKYIQEGKSFAALIALALDDREASQLYCPHFTVKGCGCLQQFIKADGQVEESKKRASLLLQLLKQAQQLSRQKYYSTDGTKKSASASSSVKCKRLRNIGLGNGQKKSRAFEEFVLENRRYLRYQLHFCERATQHILQYSNNFLHKRLKTEPERGARIERQKGKAALGLLKPIDDFPRHECCSDKCVVLAMTHSNLLQQWRDRAISGQAEARRVLAEMLTPCGGARTNCHKFISMVTGCSRSTIGSVGHQMRKTGGDREPPEHGLKRWWKDHPRSKPAAEVREECQEEVQEPSFSSSTSFPVGENSHDNANSTPPVSQSDTTLELQAARQQLLQLERQVAQQQLQIQQQQQIIDQQIISPQVAQLQQVLNQAFQSVGATTVGPDSAEASIVTTPASDSVTPTVIRQRSTQSSSQPTNIKETPATSCNQILQNILMDVSCSTESSTCKTLDVGVSGTPSSSANTMLTTAEFITILQQPNGDNENHSDQSSNQSMNSGFSNFVLIDPSSLVLSGNIGDSQTGVNTPSFYVPPPNNWEENQ